MKGTNSKTRSADKQKPWTGKAPQRGQWKASKAHKTDIDDSFKIISVKLRYEEKEEFKRVCKSMGVTPNKALRIFARQSAGYLEVSDTTLEHLETITRQITGVSKNINQIARAANRTHSPDFIAFMEDRKELGAYLGELEDIIRGIVNVGKRRTDGLKTLKDLLAVDEAGQ